MATESSVSHLALTGASAVVIATEAADAAQGISAEFRE